MTSPPPPGAAPSAAWGRPDPPAAGPGAGDSSPAALPAISTPKGGGAIKGIGEKFGTNPVTGTASMSVPIPLSPGRSGFGPSLSLSYDSGNGNGVWGFGWALDTPAVARRTDKGLPVYRDADESDVFILSGAEDLVPVLRADGARDVETTTFPGFAVHRYRPRIEGLFARIERWVDTATGETHWRSISRDNVTTLYGRTAESRIEDGARPFEWLICESHDDRGNAVVYEYVPEDDRGLEPPLPGSAVRDHARKRYLKRICYGNRTSRLVQPDAADWMFEAVLDYGEGHLQRRPPDPAVPADEQHRYVDASPEATGPWPMRPDPFSGHRAGFEVRTHRRCTAVLMFHRIPELGPEPYLVRSTEVDYRDLADGGGPTTEEELAHQGSTRIASFLMSITQSGYLRQPDGRYLCSSLPPVEFTYSKPVIDPTVRTLDDASLRNLPIGLDGHLYQWVDLDGVGLPGALTVQSGAWYWRANRGDGRLGAPVPQRQAPATVAPGTGRGQLLDLQGDGRLDAAVLDGPSPGFSSRTDDGGWTPYRALSAIPGVRFDDPNLRLVDLTGDGLADILVAEGDSFTWYPSRGDSGFGPGQRVAQPDGHGAGPRLVFADSEQAVYLADMTGDGLVDLLRIRNGQVAYWPSLGHGRFGSRILLHNAPWFDRPEAFDQRRIRLADVDGSNATDIIYLGRDGVRIYLNESGNRLADPLHLRAFPPVSQFSAVQVADLLGNGTACLVWSSPMPADARTPLRYVDLMGGVKPHLLVRSINNLGGETAVQYTSSTRFYLDDLAAGRPWVTRLPFPVHCVSRVETIDRISGNRFVSHYRYAHGYFDGVEREFRGFARVERTDTEEFDSFVTTTQPGATNVDAGSHVPPVLTRTWFHTGARLGADRTSDHFAGLLHDRDMGEYYRAPGRTDDEIREDLLPDTVLPVGLTPAESREACRALKGMMLRQEVYALDAADDSPSEAKQRSATPYTVVEQNFAVRRLQPRRGGRSAVFLVQPREVLTFHYERNPADPRVNHALTLETDEAGNVLRAVAVGYGRRTASTDPVLTAWDRSQQARSVVTYSHNAYTRNVLPEAAAAGHHRTPLPTEVRIYELTGFSPEHGPRFGVEEFVRNDFALLDTATQIPFEAAPDGTSRQKRLVEHVRTLYRRDDLTAFSPLGTVESHALQGETYKVALTPSLIAQVFTRRQDGGPDEPLLADPEDLLEGRGTDQGGYVAWDGAWWVPSGRVFLDPAADVNSPGLTAAAELRTAEQHFFLTRKVVDAFGQATVVGYDVHDLLPTRSTDPLGNTTDGAHDYRVLRCREVTDPNRNRSAVAFDALGMVVATAVMGKVADDQGDALDDVEVEPAPARVRAFVADPRAEQGSLLGSATSRVVYDLDRYRRAGQPPLAATLARETHAGSGVGPPKIQLAFAFTDGLGRELQRKVQAEPGDAPLRAADVRLPGGDVRPGALVRDVGGAVLEGPVLRRWVGTGRTVFNNKGRPVKQYEPFFSVTPLYEAEPDVVETGVSPVLFYDPLERLVATLHPNHTYEKVVLTPWRQETYDVNDTVAAHGDQTGDPRTDPDVEGYVREYFAAGPAQWRTWYRLRIDGGLGAAERDAARRAEVHAATPTTTHLDVLGRAFLSVAHNRRMQDGAAVDELFATRVEFDVESNVRAVRDAVTAGPAPQGGEVRGRLSLQYDYDLRGQRIRQASAEAGRRWLLIDVSGRRIRAWDARSDLHRLTYDELRRPTGLFVTEGGVERLLERTVYGEGQGDAANHRGRIFQRFDGAGVVTHVGYDFKGNLGVVRRELPAEYRTAVDWLQDPAVTDGSFTSSTTFDALNRPVAVTTPDGSVRRRSYNGANLLEAVDVQLRGADQATAFVTGIDYNAKGQRERIGFGNGTTTTYYYDPLTARLSRLTTTRPQAPDATAAQLFTDATVVQDLRYTYDPVGNVTRVEDAALRTMSYANQLVEPVSTYTYDAVYRLVDATSREHIGQTAFDVGGSPGDHRDYPFAGARVHPNDLQALRNCSTRYEYDAVGNLTSVAHRAVGAGWTRRYEYDEPNLLEAAATGNRLTRTVLGNGIGRTELFGYDAHGNMTSMPHLPKLAWSAKDELHQVDLGGGRTAYYVYDGTGQRVRKVVEQGGVRQQERLYLGGFEIHRVHDAGTVTLERESLHVIDGERRIACVETRTVQDDRPVPDPQPLLRYQLGDHLGSSTLELDATGALIGYEEYEAFGTTSFQAGPAAAEVSLKRYRYTGKERDEESGLSYYGARYYAPWLGRWTSADPTWRGDLYVYVLNNPVGFDDPDGAEESSVSTRIWGGVRALGGALQVVGGAAVFVQVEIPVAAQVAGGIAIAHGLSDVEVGLRQAISGRNERSAVELAATGAAGLVTKDKQAAEAFGTAVDVTLGFVNPAGPAAGAPRLTVALTTTGHLVTTTVETTPKFAQVVQGVRVASAVTHGATAVHMAAGTGDKGGGGSSDDGSSSSTGGRGSAGTGGASGGGAKGPAGGGAAPASTGAAASAAGRLLKELGGTTPIPRGTNLALSMDAYLEKFAASQNSVSVVGAWDRGFLNFRVADLALFKGNFATIVDAFVSNGGRIKFNLTGLKPGFLNSVTGWELEQILKSPTWEAATDFFLEGRQLKGAELEEAVKPWRKP